MEGYNGRLDAIQAGFLTVKLRHLDAWTAGRQAAAKRYDDHLARVDGIVAPFQPESSRAVYHLYVIRVKDRTGLQKHLSSCKIDTGIHYPVPLHQQKAYANLGYKTGDFPVTEKIAAEIVSLPMFPQLRAEQQARVVRELTNFLEQSASRTEEQALQV
jgi:dTDP-4-amino-4,6-dideoxygalactose transaminase